jgi:SAM-dependent methyltransferase
VAFKDHFSVQADRYTQFRPGYPRALFEFLATLPHTRGRAWDCGTGGGQAALGLAEFFGEVVATDPSARQIEHAQQHPRVDYFVSSAERSPLCDASVDLVTVAQALHWFDLPRFYDEVRRVARPGGVIAVWSYALAETSPDVDRVVWHLYRDILDSYWPPERRIVETRYTTIPFPFREIPAGEFTMAAEWRLDDLIGYLGTWSSVQQYIERHAANPLSTVASDLSAAWGPPGTVRRVSWPLFVRVGHVDQGGPVD